jgi:hypothetical protein
MSCAICHTRREKRFCPALHDRICPQCCGTEREVSLDCPSTCEYLQQARRHERPRDLATLDQAALFPNIDVRQDFVYRREPFIVGLTFAITNAARSDRSLNDCDAIAALAALAKSYETLVGSGLVYDSATTSLPQQNIAAEIQKMLTEYRAVEQKNIGYSTLKDSEVLEALVFIIRMAHARTSGRPRSRAFLDFLFAQFPDRGSAVVAPDQAPPKLRGRLVIP